MTTTKVRDTASGLVNPTRSHAADFRRIGPNAMARLVAEGLFEKLSDDELGRPQYRITKLGRARLRALEEK